MRRSTHPAIALPADLVETNCSQCGRPLRTRDGRTICYRCLVGMGGLL